MYHMDHLGQIIRAKSLGSHRAVGGRGPHALGCAARERETFKPSTPSFDEQNRALFTVRQREVHTHSNALGLQVQDPSSPAWNTGEYLPSPHPPTAGAS